jgi:hypothetical protein
LDKDLICPGRIGIEINLTKCSHLMIPDIIQFYHNIKLSNDWIFPDDRYTPTVLIIEWK